MITIPKLSDLVRTSNVVKFSYYQKEQLWYKIYHHDGFGFVDLKFDFPVDIDDTGDGKFLNKDKAILFMRYIRKHIEYLQKSVEQV